MGMQDYKKFHCDKRGCKTFLEWREPDQKQLQTGLRPVLPAATKTIVFVTSNTDGFPHTSAYCCDTCAVEAIGEGEHLPQPEPATRSPQSKS